MRTVRGKREVHHTVIRRALFKGLAEEHSDRKARQAD